MGSHNTFKQRFSLLAFVLAIVCAVSLAALVWPNLISQLALVPRENGALLGILTMPLVHGSLQHLLVNLAPLAVLSALTLISGCRYYLSSTGLLIALSGCGLWLFGRAAFHVGASGLVFGYFGLLLGRGYFDRRPLPITIALITGLSYGGMLWGVLPAQPGVSWDGHLAGLLAGIVTSRLLANQVSHV